MPANSTSLSKGLAAMSRFFVGDATLRETLQQVSELACQAVAPADMVGITMLVEGRPRTAVFTDDTAPQIDSAQYETGNGPCLDAFRQQQVFRIGHMEDDHLWPEFSRAASLHGIKSSMSLPLVARHEGVGALNIYSRSPADFSDDDVEIGLQFAAQAAIVLANSQAYWDALHLGDDLSEATTSRATVDRATGILMGARGCSPDEAFQLLVQAARRENRKVSEVADGLVAKTMSGRASAGV